MASFLQKFPLILLFSTLFLTLRTAQPFSAPCPRPNCPDPLAPLRPRGAPVDIELKVVVAFRSLDALIFDGAVSSQAKGRGRTSWLEIVKRSGSCI